MTLIIGAKCNDGVVLVADKKEMGGVSKATQKLTPMGPLVIGEVGEKAITDAIKRQLDIDFPDKAKLSVWDIADAAGKVFQQYRVASEELNVCPNPGLPILGLKDGKGHLWEVKGGMPPRDTASLETWGSPNYALLLGRIFELDKKPINQALRIIGFLIALDARYNDAIGEGTDVAIAENNSNQVIIKHYEDPEVKETWEKGQEVAGVLRELIEDNLLK